MENAGLYLHIATAMQPNNSTFLVTYIQNFYFYLYRESICLACLSLLRSELRFVKLRYYYLSFNGINSIHAMLVIIRINVFIYHVAYQKWIYNMYMWMWSACYIIFILLGKLKEIMQKKDNVFWNCNIIRSKESVFDTQSLLQLIP